MREASVKRHLGLCPHAYQQSFDIIYLQASALFLQKNHAWLKISAYKANDTCKYLWVVSSLKFSNDSVFACSRWESLCMPRSPPSATQIMAVLPHSSREVLYLGTESGNIFVVELPSFRVLEDRTITSEAVLQRWVSEQAALRGAGIPWADISFVKMSPQIMYWGLAVVLSIVQICTTPVKVTFGPGMC